MTGRGIFVTGTNTDVGKTVITRGITGALARRGVRVVAVKPVESGAADGPQDAMALARVAHTPFETAEVSVYTFRDPVSPHLAAAREGRTIDRQPILEFLSGWTARAEVVIAEGAGGFLVPLSDHMTYAEVIADSGFDLVIVAPNILGTINATLLTIEAARTRGIPVTGVILNGAPATPLGNREAIQSYGQVPVLGEFPEVSRLDDAVLADRAESAIDLNGLLSSTKK